MPDKTPKCPICGIKADVKSVTCEKCGHPFRPSDK